MLKSHNSAYTSNIPQYKTLLEAEIHSYIEGQSSI